MNSLIARLFCLCFLLLPVALQSTSSSNDISTTQTSPVSKNFSYPVLDTSNNTLCNLNCENGGICRYMDTLEGLRQFCFCTADYTGVNCTDAALPPLKSCSEVTCQNGGMCANSQEGLKCLCPDRVFGRTCERRLRVFWITATVLQNNATINHSKALDDPKSPEYIRLNNSTCEFLHKAVEEGNNGYLVATFHDCTVTKFTGPEVMATVKLELDYALVAQLSIECIYRHLSIGIEIAEARNVTGTFSINSTFVLERANPCMDGNNDCSANAKCLILAPGIYTCACNTFSTDVSLDPYYRGRKCIYDGLIIFTCFIMGLLIGTMICLACGCRRTVWYRLRRRGDGDKTALIGMPSSYQI